MSKNQLPRAAVIGRRIGIVAFWIMTIFVMTASTRSVVAQLYGFEAAAKFTSNDEQACARELRALHTTLQDKQAEELRSTRDGSRAVRWLAAWDRRYHALEGKCSTLEATRHDLFELRLRVEALLHRHDQDQLPLTERINRALQRVEQTQPASPHAQRDDVTRSSRLRET